MNRNDDADTGVMKANPSDRPRSRAVILQCECFERSQYWRCGSCSMSAPYVRCSWRLRALSIYAESTKLILTGCYHDFLCSGGAQGSCAGSTQVY